MAKANASGVSDQYAVSGATVRRATGEIQEVLAGDGPNVDPIDKNVPGQTPAELQKGAGRVESRDEEVASSPGSNSQRSSRNSASEGEKTSKAAR